MLAQWVDHLLCIHPFEQPFYVKWGLPTTVIGNPALHRLPKGDSAAFRQHHGIPADAPVIGLLPGSRNAAIISSIVSLAKALNMDTTAEGIEAHDELEAMRKLGVNQIQGFIYASAISGDDVIEHLLSGDWVIEPDGPSRYRPDRRTVLRRVGLIHEDHRYEAMMRNLSRTGCMVRSRSLPAVRCCRRWRR